MWIIALIKQYRLEKNLHDSALDNYEFVFTQ